MTQVCRELAARVADGVASVGAAMKRGTGLSQASKLGESRGRAPEGERAPSLTLPRKRGREKEEGARRDPAQRQRCDSAERSLSTRLSALRLPLALSGRPFVRCLTKLGRDS